MPMLAPSAASSRATARPSPRLAPAITATFFWSPRSTLLSWLLHHRSEAKPAGSIEKMHRNGQVTRHPFAERSFTTDIGIAFVGPVDEERFSNDAVPRDKAPKT